ncbi:hypothetical protein C8J57DRAFT_1605314 [Mycena rebaudengoi]|nr:hypothetical protein C8J57DRAFT_1605314 [Mycena rebaudengoi]
MQAGAQQDGWIVQGISDESKFNAYANHWLSFQARVTSSTLSQMMELKKDAKKQHEQLVTLLEARSDITGSKHSSAIIALPSCPQIFHGHEAELEDVVNTLMQNCAHIAILRVGGIGKTSLATAALHNRQVEAKYSPRYFVPCHSSPTCNDIGVEKGSNMAKKIAHHFAHAPLSLLVLDNLETPWETRSPHSEVEDAPHLGLMTFIEVADDGHDEASIKELLDLTGNLPLAVSLIASVAGSERCAQALSRWKLESTQMLSESYDQKSSLDISLMLSYTSSCMTQGAQELLNILSMLPDGLTDTDLVQAKLPIIDILACKTTSIRTSLAFVDQDKLKALVPIRKHILYIHPPANVLKLKLREHFHHILDLWNQSKGLNVTDMRSHISQNLRKFNTVLHDGLKTKGPESVLS